MRVTFGGNDVGGTDVLGLFRAESLALSGALGSLVLRHLNLEFNCFIMDRTTDLIWSKRVLAESAINNQSIKAQ